MTLIASLPNYQLNDAERASWQQHPDQLCSFIYISFFSPETLWAETVPWKKKWGHNRRSCCFRGSDGNTYEDFLSSIFFFLAVWCGFCSRRVYISARLKGRAVIYVLNKSRSHYRAYGGRLKPFLASLRWTPPSPPGFNSSLFVDSFIREPVLWTWSLVRTETKRLLVYLHIAQYNIYRWSCSTVYPSSVQI